MWAASTVDLQAVNSATQHQHECPLTKFHMHLDWQV